MKYLIDKICFTYNNIDITPSIFLILFFRMLGVYVYEKRDDMTADMGLIAKKVFAVVYLISPNSTLLKRPHRIDVLLDEGDNSIYLIDENCKQDFEHPGNNALCKYYNVNDKDDLLRKVITAFSDIIERGRLPQELKCKWAGVDRSWRNLADLYIRYDLQKVSLIGKFFYPDITLYNEAMKGYVDLIDDVIDEVGDWEEGDEQLYGRYTLVNMVYEVNALCSRNKQPYFYDSDQLLGLCDDLVNMHGPSANLLMLRGQICEELLNKFSEAYECYARAYREDPDYNSYALYRIGMFKEKVLGRRQDAVSDYKAAMDIYPDYYRVLYRWGICEEHMGNIKGAIAVYRNIYDMFKHKIEGNVMRPMEIEYMYKISIKLGNLWEYGLGDITQAMNYYEKAEEAADLIEESNFVLVLMGENRKRQMNRIIKKRLTLEKVEEKRYWYIRNQEALSGNRQR